MKSKKLAHKATEAVLKQRNLSKKQNPIEWDFYNEDSQYRLVYEDCLTSVKIAKKYYKKKKFKKFIKRLIEK